MLQSNIEPQAAASNGKAAEAIAPGATMSFFQACGCRIVVLAEESVYPQELSGMRSW
jgi:hypothetical protein